jgi:hypothetical protein
VGVLDARVVAPGPEGCHRSQVGWASRFPENPQAICWANDRTLVPAVTVAVGVYLIIDGVTGIVGS